MSYDARTIANEFLKIAKESGRSMTNMQLQKLVYIAHGYSLAILDKPLIRQSVEAWAYGPVIRDLYDELREFGSGIVTRSVSNLRSEEISETDKALIKSVANAYSRFSGTQLSTMTHRSGTPWKEIYDPGVFSNRYVIDDDRIKRHYLTLLNERAGIQPA